MNNSTEVWKPITHHEGAYEVSSHGRVRSLTREVDSGLGWGYEKPGRILKASKYSRLLYLRVQLPKQTGDAKRKLHLVHRLVAKAFIPNPESLPTVNHKDGDPSNNKVENLEWMSYSDNHRHSFQELGRRIGTERRVRQLTLTGEPVTEFGSLVEAGKSVGLKFPSNIHACCKGRRKSCRGFQWEYADNGTQYVGELHEHCRLDRS